MVTKAQREATINAMKEHIKSTKTKAAAKKHLIAVGLLTPNGDLSPIYYPQDSK